MSNPNDRLSANESQKVLEAYNELNTKFICRPKSSSDASAIGAITRKLNSSTKDERHSLVVDFLLKKIIPLLLNGENISKIGRAHV